MELLRRSIASLLAMTASLVIAAGSPALAVDPVTQITDDSSCTSTVPASDGAGTIAAWQSDCDPAGTNVDGSIEIFRAVVGEAPAQLTAGSGCSSTRPSMSSDGSRIAFESSCNLTGNNADGNVEIFLWQKSGSAISQLTASTGCENLAPSISGNGNFVAFDSTCNTSGTSNDGKGSQIFRVTSNAVLKQLSDDPVGACDSTSASINSDGKTVAFDSDCDLTGGNEDLAIEIFTVNASTLEVRQLTTAPEDSCSSVRPSVDAAASIIVFHSDCDFVGANADRNDEIFTVDVDEQVEQITNVGSGSACASGEAHMAASGTSIAFSSYCRLNNSNNDGSVEVFQAGVGTSTGGILAVTDGSSCSSAAGGISTDGTRVMYDSDCNPLSDNDDHSVEIFRATACVCGGPSTRKSPPKASDALFVLRAAVGSSGCAACECDTNNDLSITASDAQRTLMAAVGLSVTLVCPEA